MRELQDAMGVLEFAGNVHFWKRYDTTHADMEASSRRKERKKESIEDLALLFTPSKTERRRRGRVPYRIRVVREEYKKLKPILEAKKEERRRTKKEARMKEVDLEAKASEKKSQAARKGDNGTRTVSATASTTANSTFSTL